MLDNLALLFQTVSGLRVDLVAKFGGGTCYCFCFYLFLKIQQRADDSPTPSNSLRWSTALFTPRVGRVRLAPRRQHTSSTVPAGLP